MTKFVTIFFNMCVLYPLIYFPYTYSRSSVFFHIHPSHRQYTPTHTCHSNLSLCVYTGSNLYFREGSVVVEFRVFTGEGRSSYAKGVLFSGLKHGVGFESFGIDTSSVKIGVWLFIIQCTQIVSTNNASLGTAICRSIEDRRTCCKLVVERNDSGVELRTFG